MVKVSSSNFLKSDKVKAGDSLKFINEGSWVTSEKYKYPDGNPRKDFIIKVEYEAQQYDFRLNKMNRDALMKAWGDETSAWINKKAGIALVDTLVGSTMRKIIMLTPLPIAGATVKPKQDDSIAWDEDK